MTNHETMPSAAHPGGSPAGAADDAAVGSRSSPLTAPICRRRALVLIGGSMAAAAAVPSVLAACASEPAPTAWVTADASPSDLEVDAPAEVSFAGTTADGDDLVGVAWLVAQADGSIVAFDPRCTHQACEYDWADGANRFECACHEAAFAVDGNVLYGPPPRPLARFETRTSGDTIELAVPEDYKAPLPGG